MRTHEDPLDVEALSLESAHKLVQEASQTLALARDARAKLQEFLTSLQNAKDGEGVRLRTPRSSTDYAALIEDFMGTRDQGHLQHIDRYIAELLQERDLYLQQLRHKAHAKAPIYRLPFDLLGEIFTTCVMLDLEEDLTNASFSDPWHIAAVSFTWREVALRTPAMWSKIALCVLPRFHRRVLEYGRSDSNKGAWKLRDARLWLERSGTAPLYLTVEHYYMPIYRSILGKKRETWAELIASLNHRIVWYDFRGINDLRSTIRPDEMIALFENPFPIIESFKLRAKVEDSLTESPTIWDVSALAGRLWDEDHNDIRHRFKMTGFSHLHTLLLDDVAKHYKFMEGITELSLHSLSIDSANPTLLMYHFSPSIRLSLRSLTIALEDFKDTWDEGVPSAVIELPNLSKLNIKGFLGLCSIFPTSFSTPALASLSVEGSRYRCIVSSDKSDKETVGVFFSQTQFPVLRILALSYIRDVDEELPVFLRAHRGITSLTLNGMRDSITSALNGMVASGDDANRLCPRLGKLEIGRSEINRLPESIVDEVVQWRYTRAQPAELFTEDTEQVVRLVSFKWDGKEMLTSGEASDASEEQDGHDSKVDSDRELATSSLAKLEESDDDVESGDEDNIKIDWDADSDSDS